MSNERILSQLDNSPYQKLKVLEMIREGWQIEEYDGYEVEMRKGYSYKMVTRNGNTYSI